tara:strand:- start:19 stop:483 length:465 start_codon:yes stop_codon:yes gene_type:complete
MLNKIKKIEKKPKINNRLTPEINTVAIQLPINNIDCPKSGCSINKINTEDKSKKLKRYFICELLNLFKVKIFTVVKIKNGFSSSIGCNLKKYKSSHLFAPFTSTPIIGTNAKKIKEIINNGMTIFFNKDVSMDEIPIIIDKANIVKVKCLEKKK